MKKVIIAIVCVLAFLSVVAYNVNHNKIDEEKEIIVSAFLPLTGPLGSIARPVKQGMDLAVDLHNSQGGLRGKQFVFRVYDTMGDPKEAITLFYGQFQQQAPAMIYCLVTGVAMNLQKLTEPRKIPLVAAVAAYDLLDEKNRFTLRNLVSPDIFVDNLKKHISKKYPDKNIKVFYENVDYSIANKHALLKVYDKNEIQLFDFDTKQQDYRPLLLKAALNNDTDIAVVLSIGATPGRMIKQMRDIGYTGDILGDIQLTAKGAADFAGNAMHDVYALTFSNTDSESTSCKHIDNKYKSKYNEKIDEVALFAYMSTDIMLRFLNDHPEVTDLRTQMDGLTFDTCLGKVEIKDGQFIYPLEFVNLGKDIK